MKLTRNQTLMLVEFSITIIAGILIIMEVPFKKLILPIYLPLLILFFVLLYQPGPLPRPKWPGYVLIGLISMAIIFDAFEDYVKLKDLNLSHVFRDIAIVLDYLWVIWALILFLVYRHILKLWRTD